MTTYYTGVTAYMNNNPETNYRLRLLAEAIFQMQPFIGLHEEDFRKDAKFMGSYPFTFIRANDHMFTKKPEQFPMTTPEEFLSTDLTSVEINGNHLVRLYIPILAEDQDEIGKMLFKSIVPVLMDLFGEDLVCVKTKNGSEYSLFNNLEEQVVVSAERLIRANSKKVTA